MPDIISVRFRSEGNAQAQREQRQQRYQPFLHNQCHSFL